MEWWVGLSSDQKCFPIEIPTTPSTDIKHIYIPNSNVNSTFSFDTKTWEIFERSPNIQHGGVQWETKLFCQLIGLTRMTCLADSQRMIDKRAGYLNKTVVVDGKNYNLWHMKRNDYKDAYFSAHGPDGDIEFRFDDFKMYVGIDGEWVEKEMVFVE